jgi:N-acetylmuramoyl-L-alanine amidase CwlA
VCVCLDVDRKSIIRILPNLSFHYHAGAKASALMVVAKKGSPPASVVAAQADVFFDFLNK